MLRPRLFLFDVDSTLLTTGGAGTRAVDRAFLDLFGTPVPRGGLSGAGRTDRDIFREALSRLPEPPPLTADLLERFRARYVRHLERTLPWSRGHLLPGVVPLLSALQEQGVALGLITGNFRDGAYLKLRHYGIESFFPDGGFGDDAEERSQVLAIALQRFAQRLETPLPPERVCVVGDTPRDIAAGHAQRCLTMAIATGLTPLEELAPCGPTFLFADLSDTMAVLGQVLPPAHSRQVSGVLIKEVEDAREWTGAQAVRRTVFVQEQKIPEELEMDELDAQAHHAVAWVGEEIIGTGRLVTEDSRWGRIGRMAVLPAHRRRGIGSAILSHLEATAQELGLAEVYLHAQAPVVGFYQRADYREEGEPFEEAGIPHLAKRKAFA